MSPKVPFDTHYASARGVLLGVSAAVLLTVAVLWVVRPSLLPGRAAHVDGPLLVSADPGRFRGGDEAIVGGEVTYEGGCLRLGREGLASYPVVWPHGTSWDEESREVVLPSGERAAVGDEVRGGGGYHGVSQFESAASSFGDYGAEGLRILAECVGPTGEVAFFNQGSDVSLVG